jgi:hypothetical protein
MCATVCWLLTVHATVSPVRAAPLLHGPVNLDVRHNQVVGVQALDLQHFSKMSILASSDHDDRLHVLMLSTLLKAQPRC